MVSWILEDLFAAIVDFFYTILYHIFSGICWLIDFIKTIFYKLCGIESLEIDGENTDLLSSLIRSESIRRVFLTVFIIGFILLVIFTMIALIKSNYQEKHNWKTVLTKTFQSFFISLLIPFTVLAGIILTNTIMSSMNTSMNAYSTGNATIGGQFLVTIGSNALKDGVDRSQVEAMFISGELDYMNLDLVRQYYNFHDFNYVIGLLGSIVILIMFTLSSLTFIQRIFDVILLYIISPISISTIPLDEGNKFKVWKDLLISKILSAYGVILVMNLFFLIIPQIYRIRFFDDGFQNGVVLILFLIGGSYAVTKASRIIQQLCGSSAGGNELFQMLYNIRTGLAFTRRTTAIVGGATAGLIAGSDYKKNRTKGKQGRMEALKTSATSNRNQRVVSDTAKRSKAKMIAAAPIRLATMPLGMLHDLSTGGIIRVGKNFVPRCRNVAKGSTITNRADVKAKPKPEPAKEEPKKDDAKPTDTTKDNAPNTGGTPDTSSDRDSASVGGKGETSEGEGSTTTTDTSSERTETTESVKKESEE